MTEALGLQKPQASSLFQVYLRLRPAPASAPTNAERFLLVEEPDHDGPPTHITLNPPVDRRRRIEKFAYTRVFDEGATQLDLFRGANVLPLLEGVLAPHGGEGTDALLATLGVTGSGKTHTMLGSNSQRGLTQLALDTIFRSIEANAVDDARAHLVESSIQASDPSDASIYSASTFLDSVFSDFAASRGSRPTTPMTVRDAPMKSFVRPSLQETCPHLPGVFPESPNTVASGSARSAQLAIREDELSRATMLSIPPRAVHPNTLRPPKVPAKLGSPQLAYTSSPKKSYMSFTSAASSRKRVNKTPVKGDLGIPFAPKGRLQQPAGFPQAPDISSVHASCDPSAEYAVVICMYEVYNDRIYDLLTPPVKSVATKDYRRRHLLFKPTEQSPDRKVVAGLRKVICGNLREALMVLEAGLQERKVAGTGSNNASSRSHGFFCVEVKKRRKGHSDRTWVGSTLSIVDLAGSERARDAKTQGATLAEAGKINESLMYLGQCLHAQSDIGTLNKPNLVPFRQCKLTELLFSNSFPSSSTSLSSSTHRRNPQRGVIIVAADPSGDFNATSQILRYGSLAREITVPRVASTTSTVASGRHSGIMDYPTLPPPSSGGTTTPPMSSSQQHKNFFQMSTAARPAMPPPSPSRTFYQSSSPTRMLSPTPDSERATMENAALEIARLADCIEQLKAELRQEKEARKAAEEDLGREIQARLEAETQLFSLEDQMQDLEQEIREECYAEFDNQRTLDRNRWNASRSLELERSEEHWDRKVEILARGVGVAVTSPSDGNERQMHESEDDKENVLVENPEQENERLRRELSVLKRELTSRTPSKRMPLQDRGDAAVGMKTEMAGLGSRLEALSVSPSTSDSLVYDETSDIGSLGGLKPKVTATGSPTKKIRRLGAHKWEGVLDDNLL